MDGIKRKNITNGGMVEGRWGGGGMTKYLDFLSLFTNICFALLNNGPHGWDVMQELRITSFLGFMKKSNF